MKESRFTVDALDGETIVMDLLDGHLYLFEAGAAVLLGHILAGNNTEHIELTVEKTYGQEALMAFQNLLRGLVEKGVVIEVASNQDVISSESDWPATLGEIVVTEYDDMSSIITMDPIHDVDSGRGWPFEATA
ncbi:unannotated protein [freshwater metagenome]|uniref:Unannotated protein n=1 Tax=freshwater metagenome TaxID=449393 RepID=A0A6J6J9X7_9ZZZZ